MYIIELIFKLKEQFSSLRQKGLHKGQNADNSDVPENDYEIEYETCEHIFRPVDSTNTVLACVKCGFLIHCSEDEFKKKNIFEQGL